MGGMFEEQVCQKMKQRLVCWHETEKGDKAKAKLEKKKEIVKWFEKVGRNKREKKKSGIEEHRNAEEGKEKETQNGKQENKKEKGEAREEVEHRGKGTAPPCGLQQGPDLPPSYNLKYAPRPNLKTGMYQMLTEQSEQGAERWEPTRIEVQGTFDGLYKQLERGKEMNKVAVTPWQYRT